MRYSVVVYSLVLLAVPMCAAEQLESAGSAAVERDVSIEPFEVDVSVSEIDSLVLYRAGAADEDLI